MELNKKLRVFIGNSIIILIVLFYLVLNYIDTLYRNLQAPPYTWEAAFTKTNVIDHLYEHIVYIILALLTTYFLYYRKTK